MAFLTQTLIFKMYIIGFAISFFMQSFFQTKFGKESAWGINRGWQTEIAIWNVFAVIVLVALIDRDFKSNLVVLALFVMSLGFAINHLLGARIGKNRRSNLLGATANGVGVLTILCWFLFSAR